jgi:hypothetical protein
MPRAPATSTTRSLPLRILSTAALVLPSLLLIISFALALTTIYSPQWAVQDIFDQNLARTRFHNLRAPFYQCGQTGAITDDIQANGTNTTCVRIHGFGLRGFNECEALDKHFDHKCQQVAMAANLMVGGVIFIALAMAVSFALLGLGIKGALAAKTSVGGEKDGHGEAEAPPQTVSVTSTLAAVMILLALTGSGLLLLAQVVGVNGLVNDVLPNANFMEFDANTPGNSLTVGSWYLGKASLVYISTAWFAGFLASYVARFDFV